jgi:hypothetical protein
MIIKTSNPNLPVSTAETATGEIEYKSAAAAVRKRFSLKVLSRRCIERKSKIGASTKKSVMNT